MTGFEIMLRHVLEREGGTVKFDTSKTCKFGRIFALASNQKRCDSNILDHLDLLRRGGSELKVCFHGAGKSP